MASRASIAITDPTGRIGSTTTATNASISTLTTIAGSQLLATFTSLPVGVYSISVSVPLANSAAALFNIESWTIGASATSAGTLAQLTGKKAVISFSTQCVADAANTTLTTDFILNNTSSSPIYINSVFQVGSITNTQLAFPTTFVTDAVIVATKIA